MKGSKAIALGALLALASCAGSPSDLSKRTDAIVKIYPDEYQLVYERISSTAKRCWTGSGMYNSAEVSSELYTNLHYGQVDLIFNDMGSRYYYFTSKIEEITTGSRLTAHTDNKRYERDVLRWAEGDMTCS